MQVARAGLGRGPKSQASNYREGYDMATTREPADVIEDLEFLDSTQVGATDAAKRTGFPNAHAMEKWLDRHDQHALWLRFKGRDPVGAHPSGSDRPNVGSVTNIDPIAAMLDLAGKSKVAKTRKAADRARALIDTLRTTLTQEREDEQQAAAARRDIERLERQLAEAKARLKGGRASVTVGSGVSAAELRAWAKANGVECPAMGKVPGAVREAFEAAQDDEAATA